MDGGTQVAAARGSAAHFGFLTEAEREELFAEPPRPLPPGADRHTRALHLGATVYSPATRTDLAGDARRLAAVGATSHVWCLEDAVEHLRVDEAEQRITQALAADHGPLPQLFVRVRTPEQLVRVAATDMHHQLAGFVLPKLSPREAAAWFAALDSARTAASPQLLVMPVLEHPDLAWSETRTAHLADLRGLLGERRDDVLAVRVGATDLSGLFGIRRDPWTTVWEVAVIRDALADVVNAFRRNGDHVVTGAVWEHFGGAERLLRPQLRQTPFAEPPQLRGLRASLLSSHLDELIREVLHDRANGLSGKTVIHPSHVSVVNALQAVTAEELSDARGIVDAAGSGGVRASDARNKMNEVGPHLLWAQQLIARAEVFGALREPHDVVALMEAGQRAAETAFGVGTRG